MEQIIDLSTYDPEKKSKILHMLAQKGIDFTHDKNGKLVSPTLQLESIDPPEPTHKEAPLTYLNKFKLSPKTSLASNFLLNYPMLQPTKPKGKPKPSKTKYDWLSKIAIAKEAQKNSKLAEQEKAQLIEEKRLHKLEQQALNGLDYDKLNIKFEVHLFNRALNTDNPLTTPSLLRASPAYIRQ